MDFRIAPLVFLLLSCLPLLLIGDERDFRLRDMISIENLKQHVRNLHFDRNPYDHSLELEKAAQYIQEEFLKMGWDVEEDPFQWEGRPYKNIVAEKKGTTFSENILILGAHYDTVPGSPGADDNASAVAVLLEVARNIQAIPLSMTLKLIAFSLEEVGYIGSTHYAEDAKKRGDQIFGMISLEMVGFTGLKQNYPVYLNPKYYSNIGDFIGIIANERSKALMGRIQKSIKTHIPQLPSEYLLVPKNGDGMEEVRLSDHSPFWDHGFPALMVTDTAFLRNPNYHLPSDSIETLDFEFMRKVAIGIYYSVVELAK
jgi:Zn-dependent M28 family amino/carboxypeptidase